MNRPSLFMAMALFILSAFTSYAQTASFPHAGDGTQENPYQISNLENLRWIAESSARWSLHYIQSADIDASATQNWDGKAGWQPIGNSSIKFTGSYNGKGFVIDGLHIERTDTDYTGLFGYTDLAKIDSLEIRNVKISGKRYIGGLAGRTTNTRVNYCHVSGELSGESYIGGITGYNYTGDARSYNADITNCSANVIVSGKNRLGGLAGYSSTSTSIYPCYIKKCYAISEITGEQYIGGLIGENSTTVIHNSYAHGSLTTSSSYIGGLIGRNTGRLNTVYSACSISKKNTSSVGGLIGFHSGSTTMITNSFWDTEKSELANSAGGTGKTSLEMRDVATYTSLSTGGLTVAWDFADNPNDDTGEEDYWSLSPRYNDGLPFLGWQDFSPYPEIGAFSVSETSNHSFTASARLNSLGNNDPVYIGFCWNISGLPTIEDTKTENILAELPFSFAADITGLDVNTAYFIRPFAIHNSGVVYGNEINFATPPTTPQLPAGSGTVGDPYQIASLENLFWLTTITFGPSGIHCIQTMNIDASETANWNSGKGWSPIGSSSSFSGSYNGQNYRIDGLFINRPDEDNQGLFGFSSAKIENLGLTNVNITGKDYTGSIVGYHWNGLDNCYSTGVVAGANYVGGITGRSSKLPTDQYTISNCYSECNINAGAVSGNFYGAGGLAGSTSVELINCFTTGNVTGVHHVGGLSGNNTATITNSYSTGNVDGNSDVGGLTGSQSGTLVNCYSTGNVNAFLNAGGLTGSTNGSFINSYFNLDVVLINGEKAISAGALYGSEYESWISNNKMLDVNNYLFSDGNHYLINNLQDFKYLLAFGNDSLNFLLTTDLDLSSEPGFYIPTFTGVFNGNGHTISNLNLSITSDRLGLFGALRKASIEELRVTKAVVTGINQLGLLAGFVADTSQILNCFVEGNLKGINYAGGLIGSNLNSTINHCVSFGHVSGENNIGGLIGSNDSKGVIENCYSNTTVNAEIRNAGGLAGYNGNNSIIRKCYASGNVFGGGNSGGLIGENLGQLSNCYAIGNVVGGSNIGGLTGRNYSNQIFNCYSTGKVKGTNYNIGGLMGVSNSPTATFNSFWNTETSGLLTSTTGTGKNIAEMRNTATYTSLSSGAVTTPWDFVGNLHDDTGVEDIWNINPEFNHGFPYLNWQDVPGTPQILTSNVSDINSTLAIATGFLMNSGEPSPVQHGFCWNTTGMPDVLDNITAKGLISESSYFSDTLTRLLPNTTYYLRAYASFADDNIIYGEVIEFTTLAIESIVPEGTGTLEDPYEIQNLGNLLWVALNAEHWDKHYIQISDIDASSTSEWYEGRGWNPIGIQSKSFTGRYNGKGHVIENLYINRPDKDFQGLFGHGSGALIDSLGLTHVDINGKDFSGGILGFAQYNSKLKNCFVTGTIQGKNSVGGLIGFSASTDITSSFASANVTGVDGNYTGGLIGRSSHGSISNSYSAGNVQGVNMIGGFVGYSEESILTNNYSLANVSGEDMSGGLIGIIINSPVSKCYSAGSVTGSSNTGGLIGTNNYSAVNNSFWDTETSGHATGSYGTGKPTSEMNSGETFLSAGWDFMGETANGTMDNWAIYPSLNENYPFFMWQSLISLPNVETVEITDLTNDAARLHGNIVSPGYPEQIFQHGFCWNTTGNPSLEDSKTEIGPLSEPATFTSTITGLMPGTQYFVRAYATTEIGTAYGDVMSFATTKKMLTVGGSFTVTDREYDGTKNAWIWNRHLNLIGVNDGDQVFVVEDAIFIDKEVGIDKPVELSFVGLYGKDAHKYTVTLEGAPTTTASIFPKTITIGGSFTANNKFYDGNYEASIKTNNLILNGKHISDDVSLTHLEVVFTDTTFGNNLQVRIIHGELSGTDADNYLLSLQNSPTSVADITGYILTITFNGDGRVLVDEDTNILTNAVFSFFPGSEVSLESSQAYNCIFLGWTGDLVSENPLESIIMNQHTSITASFICKKVWRLDLQVMGKGTVIINDTTYVDSEASYPGIEDSEISLKAIPDEGFKFLEWKGDLVSENADELLFINDHKTVTAVFINLVDVNPEQFPELTIYPNPFKDHMYIKYSQDIERISLSTLLGETLLDRQVNGKGVEEIIVSGLEKGIYLITMHATDGRKVSRKVVKK